MAEAAGPASIEPKALSDRIAWADQALVVLDVRTPAEYAEGHVPGAINIPFTKMPYRMDIVPGGAEDELIVYCGHGPRAYIAAATLRHAGRKRILYLSGHWAAWLGAGLPIER